MSRVVVIGATGHIGSYLVPRLVRAGHEVIALSRGAREPYHPSAQWASVSRVSVDRDAEDAAGTFGGRIADLRADVVMDLICFTADSARQLAGALRPSRPLLIHCGTIWVHGPALRVPVTEDEPRTAYGEYGASFHVVAEQAEITREHTARSIARTASSRSRSCRRTPSTTSTCPPLPSAIFTPASDPGTPGNPSGSSTWSTRVPGTSSRPS
jgi:NAD(P)-dependent dehydrogenase (short-subunit alcohol dehydrogenase family)